MNVYRLVSERVAVLMGLADMGSIVIQASRKPLLDEGTIGVSMVTPQDIKFPHLAYHQCRSFASIKTNVAVIVADIEAIAV